MIQGHSFSQILYSCDLVQRNFVRYFVCELLSLELVSCGDELLSITFIMEIEMLQELSFQKTLIRFEVKIFSRRYLGDDWQDGVQKLGQVFVRELCDLFQVVNDILQTFIVVQFSFLVGEILSGQ